MYHTHHVHTQRTHTSATNNFSERPTGERYPPPTEPLSPSLPPSRAAAPHSPPQTRPREARPPAGRTPPRYIRSTHFPFFLTSVRHTSIRPSSFFPAHFLPPCRRPAQAPDASGGCPPCLVPCPAAPGAKPSRFVGFVLLGSFFCLFCWVLSFVPFVLSALHTFASVGADLRYLLRTPGPSPNAVGALSRPPT